MESGIERVSDASRACETRLRANTDPKRVAIKRNEKFYASWNGPTFHCENARVKWLFPVDSTSTRIIIMSGISHVRTTRLVKTDVNLHVLLW